MTYQLTLQSPSINTLNRSYILTKKMLLSLWLLQRKQLGERNGEGVALKGHTNTKGRRHKKFGYGETEKP